MRLVNLKTFVVVYLNENGDKVSEVYTAKNKGLVVEWYNNLNKVMHLVSVEKF